LISKIKRLGIDFEQISTLREVASLPISEDPILRNPLLNGTSQGPASSRNSKPDSRAARVCTLAEAEREHISEVLQMTNGLIAGKGGAAEVLGLPASTLRNRMKKLGIKSKQLS
jgi:transcriptional regulator with GAF, ATPase, and Fis domain